MKYIGWTCTLATVVSAVPLSTQSTWSGWKNVKHLFVFGDSYTQTGFDVKGAQPSLSNPLGNPTYPGWTSSNGPNWVGFLTTTYNASKLLTYNVAYGGATVDADLVTPYTPTVLSLKNQVQDEYIPAYGTPSNASVSWTASDSLHAFFIGINDVGNSWWLDNATTIYDKIFTVYGGLLDQVYDTGARNFLFLSVPPVNLAPITLVNGNWSIEHEGAAIAAWNEKLANMTAAFNARHKNTTKTFIHDTHGVYEAALKDPKVFPQTAGVKNTTTWCKAYEK